MPKISIISGTLIMIIAMIATTFPTPTKKYKYFMTPQIGSQIYFNAYEIGYPCITVWGTEDPQSDIVTQYKECGDYEIILNK